MGGHLADRRRRDSELEHAGQDQAGALGEQDDAEGIGPQPVEYQPHRPQPEQQEQALAGDVVEDVAAERRHGYAACRFFRTSRNASQTNATWSWVRFSALGRLIPRALTL